MAWITNTQYFLGAKYHKKQVQMEYYASALTKLAEEIWQIAEVPANMKAQLKN